MRKDIRKDLLDDIARVDQDDIMSGVDLSLLDDYSTEEDIDANLAKCEVITKPKDISESDIAEVEEALSYLTMQQRQFVMNYVVSFDDNLAARRAGYTRAGLSKLRKNPTVLKAIETIQGKSARRVQIDSDDILRGLLKEAYGLGPDTSSTTRISAFTLVGKQLGMFKDKTEVSGSITIQYVNDWRKVGKPEIVDGEYSEAEIMQTPDNYSTEVVKLEPVCTEIKKL